MPFLRIIFAYINDANCKENVRETSSLLSLLKCFGTRNAKVLDYWADNSLFSGWKYPPKPFKLNSEVMKDDVAYYQSLGFESLTAFGCYLGKDYTDLYKYFCLITFALICLSTKESPCPAKKGTTIIQDSRSFFIRKAYRK